MAKKFLVVMETDLSSVPAQSGHWRSSETKNQAHCIAHYFSKTLLHVIVLNYPDFTHN